jgi:hypothetical protein
LSEQVTKRRWWVTVCIVLGIVAAVWIKVRLEAGQSLAQAKQLESQSEIELAIVCYRRTVRWYSPFSGPVSESLERLWSMGQRLEEKGHTELALLAYRSIRSALMGIRHVNQPHASYIPKSSVRIAALMAQVEGAKAGSKKHEERAEYHRRLLLGDHAPDVAWSLLAVLGFLAWCFCLYGLAMNAFDDETGAIIVSAAIRRGALVVSTLVLWLVALGQA